MTQAYKVMSQSYKDEVKAAKALFASRLAQALQAKGWTQAQLHRAAGLNRAVICTYFGRRSLPKRPHLEALARALDVQPDELLPPELQRPPAADPEAVLLAPGEVRFTSESGGFALLQMNMRLPQQMAAGIVGQLANTDVKDGS